MQRKNAKNRTGNVIGNAFFRLHLLSFSIYCVKQKEKTTIYCGFWRTHRESNPELTLRRGLFYPLNYECKLRILRKLVNDMAFSKTLPKTLPIFYSVVENARYLAFFGLKSPIFLHFRRIHLALRRGLLYPFNYGSIFNFITPAKVYCMKKFIPNFIPISIFLITRLTRLVLLYLIFP